MRSFYTCGFEVLDESGIEGNTHCYIELDAPICNSRRRCHVRKLWATEPFLKDSFLAKCFFYESEKNENEWFVYAFLASIRKTIDIER